MPLPDISQFNLLTILVAAVSTFLIGGVWYQALFAEGWRNAAGLSKEQVESGNMAQIFGGSIVLAIVEAFALAVLIGKDADTMDGLYWGLVVGVGFVAAALGVNYLFEQKSLKLFVFNGGYNIVTFAIMGAILGMWL